MKDLIIPTASDYLLDLGIVQQRSSEPSKNDERVLTTDEENVEENDEWINAK